MWWTHKGRNISDDDGYKLRIPSYITQTTISSKITFVLEPTREGWYSCQAENHYDPSIRAASYTTVSGHLPLLTSIAGPRYVITPAGDSVTLTCNVHQWPLRTTPVFWKPLDGAHIPVITTSTIENTTVENTTDTGRKHEVLRLVLPNVTEDDAGVFQCGQQIASLYVESLAEEPYVSFEAIGHHVLFTCTVHGSPTASPELILNRAELDKEEPIETDVMSSVATQNSVTTEWYLTGTFIDTLAAPRDPAYNASKELLASGRNALPPISPDSAHTISPSRSAATAL